MDDDDWDTNSENEAIFEEGLIEEDLIPEDLIPDDEIPDVEIPSTKNAIIEYPDGSIFEGMTTIEGKKISGKQTYSSDSLIIYIEGTFENEELVHGKCVYKNGDEYEGDWKNGQPHGHGIFKYQSDAKVYIGTFSHGMRQGSGTCAYVEGSWFDGQKYEGHWLNDDWHGHGRLTYKDGIVYEGSFAAGACHGAGALTYPDGRRMTSSWIDDTRQNPSHIFYPNGDEFVGSVELGTGHKLEGTYTHANGNVFKGSYTNDQRRHGVLAFNVTSMAGDPVELSSYQRYEGEWAMINEVETQHGFGKMEYADGRVYEGIWVEGRRSGRGQCAYGAESGPFEGQVYNGEWRDNKWEGTGILLFPNGDRYDGMFYDGNMHGKAVFTSSMDGVKHEGVWVEGKEPTTGRWIYPNGDVFEGEIIDGVQNGIFAKQQDNTSKKEEPVVQDGLMDLSMQTTQDAFNTSIFSDDDKSTTSSAADEDAIEYSNGDKYVGEKNSQGIRHGHGVLTEKSGNVYDGQFRNGWKYGQGTYTYENGDVYTGDFVNDQRHGVGIIKFKKGGYATGTWSKDRMHGEKCEFQHHSGLMYVGGFDNHRKHGTAKMKFPDGSSFLGDVRNNKLHGKGTYTHINGDVYAGDFEDGFKQGRGRMTYKEDGSVYDGEFRRGKRNGVGALTHADGRKIMGVWKKDDLDKGAEVVKAEDTAMSSSFLCLPRSSAYGKIK